MSDAREQLQAALGTQYTLGRELGHGGMATELGLAYPALAARLTR
jgi:hypothetical protein